MRGVARALTVAVSLASLAYGFTACTAITAAMWSGYTDGTDASGIPPQQQTACNPSYLSAQSQCGACMNANCASDIGKVCKLESGYTTPWPDTDLLACAKSPTVGSFECNQFLKAPDAAFSNGTDPAALESNVTQCIKANCHDDCRRCVITYSGCQGKTVTLGTEKSRSCGKCILTQCPVELANACGANLDTDPITACAQNPTDTCNATDCSKLHTQDAGSSAQAYACILSKCASECQ